MKKFLKALLWVVAGIAAVLIYMAADDDTRKTWGLGVALAYGFWLLMKQFNDAERRLEARLERLENLLHQQTREGLSLYEREGLSAMLAEHKIRRQDDQP